MTVGSNKLLLAYDANGTPLAVTYNGTAYYYVTNLQGDVVAILNTSGTAVVTYSYDAWGNLLSTGGSMASTLGQQNPLRYRGYVYDAETELYYLQSRYYNPEWGRFLNADSSVSTGQGELSCNMFAYCLNNPVNGCDPCGTCFHRWDFWNDCEKCVGATFGERLLTLYSESLDRAIDYMISTSQYGGVVSLVKSIHYGRNIINQPYTEQELTTMGISPLPESEDKFHQNNQKGGRNKKYVVGDWFSSEVVLYSDGTLNDTPEDRGTVNVYYGDNPFGKYVIHGLYDVAPYMLWGNSADDSTTILDRVIMCFR